MSLGGELWGIGSSWWFNGDEFSFSADFMPIPGVMPSSVIDEYGVEGANDGRVVEDEAPATAGLSAGAAWFPVFSEDDRSIVDDGVFRVVEVVSSVVAADHCDSGVTGCESV